MLSHRLIIIVLLISNINIYGQTNSGINKNNLKAIENDSLKNFVANFESPSLPFTFSEPNEEKLFDFQLLNQFLKLEIDEEEGFGYDEYYFGYVFFEKNYLGLIYTHYYTPGAFGINNYFVKLMTLNYDGSFVDTEELGCFCNDTNLGSNDYYSTELDIRVEADKITVDKKNIHATLIENEGEESFEDIKSEIYVINIDLNGMINRDQ